MQVKQKTLVLFLLLLAFLFSASADYREVWTCGSNVGGQLAISENLRYPTAIRNVPQAPQSSLKQIKNFASILGVMTDGNVFAFGINAVGQLGIGNTDAQETPQVVNKAYGKAKSAWGGPQASFIINTNDELYAMGSNKDGLIGSGAAVIRSIPFKLDVNVTSVASNDVITIYSNASGQVYITGKLVNALPKRATFFSLDAIYTRPVLLNTTLDFVSSVYITFDHEKPTLYLLKNTTNTSSLYSTGWNDYGQLGIGVDDWERQNLTLIQNLTNIGSICTGGWHVMTLIDGNIYSWGGNLYGQLGLGHNRNQNAPSLVSTLTKVTSISCGIHHSVALTSTAEVFSWGSNSFSQLGLGTFVNQNLPQLVVLSIENDVSMISAGGYCSLMLTTGVPPGPPGGLQKFGEFLVNPSFKPVSDLGGNPQLIGAGEDFTIIGMNDNTVKAAGQNTGGTLGTNTTESTAALLTLPGITNVQKIISNGDNAFLFRNNGGNSSSSVYGLGLNKDYQLGLGSVQSVMIPTLINLPSIKDVALGEFHTLFLLHNGSVFCSGVRSGCLDDDLASNHTPILIPGLPFIEAVFAGKSTSWFKKSDGKMMIIGKQAQGELGTEDDSTVYPAKDHPLDGIVTLLSTYQHTLAFVNNTLYVCGVGNGGLLGLGHTNSSNKFLPLEYINSRLIGNLTIVQVLATRSSSMILLSVGRLFAWGTQEWGSFGLGDTKTYLTPQQLPLFNNILSIAASRSHTILLTSCKDGFSGQNCSSNVCFGIPGHSPAVCSGTGTCVGFNVCSCTSPSFGDVCQYSEYYWKGLPAKWSDTLAWSVKKGERLNRATSVPSKSGDSVFINERGTYEVTVDIARFSLTSISIGGPGANVVLNFDSITLDLTKNLFIQLGSTVNCKNSIIRVSGTISVLGSTIWKNCTVETASFNANSTFITFEKSTFKTNTFRTSLDTKIVTSDSTFSFSTPGEFFGTSQFFGNVFQGSFRNFGSLFLDSVCTFNSPIENHGNMYASFNLLSTAAAKLTNFGIFTINTTLNPDIQLQIENFNTTQLLGTGSAKIARFMQTSTMANIYIRNTTLSSPDKFDITLGNIYASGKMNVKILVVDSTGFLQLLSPYTLEINGNATFGNKSTIFSTMRSSTGGDQLTVSGTLILAGLILVKTQGYTPKLGDYVPFASWANLGASTPQVSLLGVPYKQVEFDKYGTTGNFKVMSSFGSVSSEGYDCHYLGNGKVLEMNWFRNQEKILLSATFSDRSKWVGIGFGNSNSTTSSLGVMVRRNGTLDEIFEVVNHYSMNQIPSLALDISTSISPTVFEIGLEPRTVNILVSTSVLRGQNKVYYAEVDSIVYNSSIKHYFESFDYSVLTVDGKLNKQTTQCTNFLQPLRAEIYDWAPWSIMLIIYVFLFVMCCIFYRFIPLKTRGVSPFLTLIFLGIQLLLEVKNRYEIQDFQGSLCFYYSFSVFPLQVICFAMILLYFIRYFAIINLNQNKKNVYQKIKLGKNIDAFEKLKSRALKLLSSSWMTIGILLLTFVVVVGIFFVVLAGDAFVCKFSTLIALKLISNIELIIIYVLTIATLVGDVVGNFKFVRRCKLYKYIFKQDPYWFRAQIVLFMPFMVYSIVVEVFSLVTSTSYLWIATYHNPNIALNTILLAILLIIEVIFPLAITIIVMIRRCLRKKKEKSVLDDILKKEESKKLFVKFCEKEFSLENISCYEDVKEYEKATSVAREQLATEIFEKYLKGADSIMEVNIPSRISTEIKKKMDEKMLSDDLYRDLVNNLRTNLADTFGRFCFSSEWENYLKNQEKQKEMIEGN